MSTNLSEELAQVLERARRLAATGEDQAAQAAYIEVLRHNPAHHAALDVRCGDVHRVDSRLWICPVQRR